MAQNLALAEGLSGYGFNSLPVSSELVSDIAGMGGSARDVLNAYSGQHEFINSYNTGDIARTWYGDIWGGDYLDPGSTRVYDSGIANRSVSAGLGLGLFLGSGLTALASLAVSGLFMHPLMVTPPGKTNGSAANPGIWSYDEGELVYRR
jgi:hypothetical protein